MNILTATLAIIARDAKSRKHITDIFVQPNGLFIRMYADRPELFKETRMIAWTEIDTFIHGAQLVSKVRRTIDEMHNEIEREIERHDNT